MHETWGQDVQWNKPFVRGRTLRESTYMVRSLEESNPQRRKAEGSCQELGRSGGWGVSVSRTQSLSLGRGGSPDGSDACLTLWMYSLPLSYTEKWLKCFILCDVYFAPPKKKQTSFSKGVPSIFSVKPSSLNITTLNKSETNLFGLKEYSSVLPEFIGIHSDGIFWSWKSLSWKGNVFRGAVWNEGVKTKRFKCSYVVCYCEWRDK